MGFHDEKRKFISFKLTGTVKSDGFSSMLNFISFVKSIKFDCHSQLVSNQILMYRFTLVGIKPHTGGHQAELDFTSCGFEISDEELAVGRFVDW